MEVDDIRDHHDVMTGERTFRSMIFFGVNIAQNSNAARQTLNQVTQALTRCEFFGEYAK